MHSLQIINWDVPIIFITILIITVKAQGLVKAKFVSKKVKMFLHSKMQIELKENSVETLRRDPVVITKSITVEHFNRKVTNTVNYKLLIPEYVFRQLGL